MWKDNPDLFWSRVDKESPDGCWLWGFQTDPVWGYGVVRWQPRVDGRLTMQRAHRVAFTLANGEIPEGMFVLHSCDVRACCRPEHLSVGSIADNVADMMAKGRYKAATPDSFRLVSAERREELREAYRVARFWAKVDRRGPDECWEWLAHRDAKGYGRVGVAPSRSDRAYRVAYRLAHGPIPDGLCVMHSCDHPPCVNPAHLSLGTKAENSLDMHSKARSRRGDTPRGERHHAAKLTDVTVREIRAAVVAGAMQKTLCARYGVSAGVMSEIVNRKAWVHVT